jgi:hypothetical protein
MKRKIAKSAMVADFLADMNRMDEAQPGIFEEPTDDEFDNQLSQLLSDAFIKKYNPSLSEYRAHSVSWRFKDSRPRYLQSDGVFSRYH